VDEFPEESRGWLCHYFLLVTKWLRDNTKPDVKGRRAERATEVLLEAGRAPGATEEARLEEARTIAAKHFGVKRDSLRRTHSRRRKADQDKIG
jgi:hypothetical protein